MRVVCAACNAHYADINVEDLAERLALSDALAVYHLAHCTASVADHAAAWSLMESITELETAT